jgi:DNA-binding CsgD family transcriptional regulator
MLDTLPLQPALLQPLGDGPSWPRPIGPDLAWRALEEVDFGLVLLEPTGVLHHANHLARHELARSRFLRLQGQTVTGVDAAHDLQLLAGLRQAGRGRRQLVLLERGQETLAVACVPLGSPFEGTAPPGLVLLMLGRHCESQRLAITFFARSHSLTPAEENVLQGLCAGQSVAEIAQANGTAEGTVRTQVRTLREKTAAPSIRLLVQRIAALPPVVPVSLTLVRQPGPQWMA